MNATAILSSPLLDIIFENRNKSYGAYLLRKKYHGHLTKALIIMLLFATMICLVFMLNSTKKSDVAFIKPDVSTTALPTVYEPEKPKPLKPVAAVTAPSNQDHAPIIVKDRDADSVVTDHPEIPAAVHGDVTQPGDVPTGGTEHGKDSAVVKPAEPLPVKPLIDKTIPVAHAEVDPSFPGGMAAFTKYMQSNLRAPEDIDAGAEVAVKIKFIVNFDGTLKGFEVVKTGGQIFDEEVLRVLKKMPKWIPGKTSGETVSVFFTLPVTFRTNE